ncbi:MAG: ribonuclease HII [Peptococcaceae bacterium]|jgi:ribonuclease HII|nr:MAG: ribonuclease HII [Peptococcaceae bacterium]
MRNVSNLKIERELWTEGRNLIAGVDEAGRGSLLGSVVAAAVILPRELVIDGIRDSKQLTAKKRRYFYEVIVQKALAFGLGVVNENIIDLINIRQAALLAMKMAVTSLKVKPEYILIDGSDGIPVDIPQRAVVSGDCLSQSIAAASVLAKVERDNMCLEWDEQCPGYNIGVNKGYGTKEHRELLLAKGPSPLHRITFLKKIYGRAGESY